MIAKKSKIYKTLLMTAGFLNIQYASAQEKSWTTWASQNALAAGVVAAVGTSVAYSIENLRLHNDLLTSIEDRYGIKPVYEWYDMPAQYTLQALCSTCKITQVIEMDNSIKAIEQKVAKTTSAQLFNFGLFTHNLPHIDQNGYYCIAAGYFKDFNCSTLGKLKEEISATIDRVNQDVVSLKKVISFPKSVINFNDFQHQISQAFASPVINSACGYFGYSALYNSDRAKNCVIALSKYHAYLNLLQELFNVCVDPHDTNLKSGGYLKFTIQHNQYNQSVQIN